MTENGHGGVVGVKSAPSAFKLLQTTLALLPRPTFSQTLIPHTSTCRTMSTATATAPKTTKKAAAPKAKADAAKSERAGLRLVGDGPMSYPRLRFPQSPVLAHVTQTTRA